jgi:hypothetical protein
MSFSTVDLNINLPFLSSFISNIQNTLGISKHIIIGEPGDDTDCKIKREPVTPTGRIDVWV